MMPRHLSKKLLALAVALLATDEACALRGSRDLQTFSVVSFELVNVASNEVVAGVSNNAVISIDPDAEYNLMASTTGSVGSVVFGYNSNPSFRTESVKPYAFCGDLSGVYTACSELMSGTLTITATPYSSSGGQGTAGATQTITFTLVTGAGPVPVPTTAPVTTPTTAPISAPTTAPVPAPTLAPVPGPTQAPVPAPVVAPTLAPVVAPTLAPVPAPTQAPVTAPTLAPVPAPTTSPVPAPVQAPNNCRPPRLVGNWEDAAEYPINRVLEAQGAIIGSDFVVVSGFINGIRQASQENFALDLTNPNASWRPIADLPVPQGITHGAFVVVGSKFYMCGGYLGGHPGPHIDTCLVYDHDANSWAFFEPLPEGRAGGGMIYDSINDALVFSAGAERPIPGNPNAEDYQHTWMYTLSNPGQGWVEKEDIPYLTNHMSYATARDASGRERHFFLAGQVGENERSGNVDDNYEWDVATQSWITREFMPFTRGHASSSTNAVNCGFIIAAGSTNEMGKTSDVSYYDVPTDSWTKVGDLPQALNTPVCDIDFERGYYYCFTGAGGFETRIKIEF